MVMNLLGLILLFSARVLGISINVVRILFLVRGQRLISSCLGFFEALTYILVLGTILGGGKSLTFLEIFCYCGGFATGNYVGAWLEECLLNSFVLVEVIMDDDPPAKATVDALRAAGLGVTVISGMGLKGPKLVVKIICRRHDTATVQKFFSGQSLMVISDVKRCVGGWFPQHI